MVSMPDVDDACIACLMCSIMVDTNWLYSGSMWKEGVENKHISPLCHNKTAESNYLRQAYIIL